MTREERLNKFLERANDVSKGENLDFSLVPSSYVNNKTKVPIIDHSLRSDGSEYGMWQVTPDNFLKGRRHHEKRSIRISNSKIITQEEYIKKCLETHQGENLDLSNLVYRGMDEDVEYISHDKDIDGKEFGSIRQNAKSFIEGHKHARLSHMLQGQVQRYNTKKFIEIASKVFPDYDWSKVEYKSSQEKVCVICQKHGEFFAYPDALIQGRGGCPVCGNHRSDGECELYEFIESLLGNGNVIRGDKSVLNGFEIDLLIPSKNIGIEFDGLRWHSEEFKEDKNYHLRKTELAASKGVTLIHIFEDEWLYHKEVVLDKIRHMLQCDENKIKAYGRKCKISEIDNNIAKDFLNKNHIQGFAASTVYFGAYYENELVGVMCFLNEGNGKWNLNRFATDINYSCPGLASKLFRHFCENYEYNEIKSFLDRRWCVSSENVYTKLGFKLEEITKPNYTYTNGHGERKHKFGFRKNKLLKMNSSFDESMTESEMTQALGFYKIWDCGLLKYVFRK